MKLLKTNADNWVFWCPACKGYHEIDSRWVFNGSVENPTFTPSIHVFERNAKKEILGTICHCYITNGKIQYLKDSRHSLAGKTVGMEDA